MRKRYLNAMALVAKYGKPDLFITMTRIFRSKFQELRKDVIKKQLFGPVAAYTFVIEFQKRGLPHVHMLLILQNKYKLITTDQFDAIIPAELPQPVFSHGQLYVALSRATAATKIRIHQNKLSLYQGSHKNNSSKMRQQLTQKQLKNNK